MQVVQQIKYPGITVAEPGTLLAKTWRKLVGQVRVQERFCSEKRVSFFAYIDYGKPSMGPDLSDTRKWFGK